MLDTFDLTVCMGATDGEFFLLHRLLRADLEKKHLRVHHPDSIPDTVLRIMRYQRQYGFTIRPREVEKLIGLVQDGNKDLRWGGDSGGSKEEDSSGEDADNQHM